MSTLSGLISLLGLFALLGLFILLGLTSLLVLTALLGLIVLSIRVLKRFSGSERDLYACLRVRSHSILPLDCQGHFCSGFVILKPFLEFFHTRDSLTVDRCNDVAFTQF